jgi:hypothetical protein
MAGVDGIAWPAAPGRRPGGRTPGASALAARSDAVLTKERLHSAVE